MKINEKTKLFEDLSNEERLEMYEMAEGIVLLGKVPYPMPAWAEEWVTKYEIIPAHRLLVIATVLPQYMLLSLLKDRP